MITRRSVVGLPPALSIAQAFLDLKKETVQATGFPYIAYSISDRFGRRIRFFVTQEEDNASKLPLIVSILGSGADSNFLKRGDRLLDGHRVLREVFKGRARIAIVEKPGLQLGEHPEHMGTSEGPNEEFRREYTLERWSEAISAAMRAAATLPYIDSSRTLVVGHSEGGLVACTVAAMNPFVTHVASLAGGGPTRLFSLIEFCRAGILYKDVSDDPKDRVKKLVDDWQQVLRDPESSSKLFLGHSHRAWTSFARSSCVSALNLTKARVYIWQGTEDKSVAPAATDVLYAELLARGRDCTLDWVVGADHGFKIAAEPARDVQREVFERIRLWFTGSS